MRLFIAINFNELNEYFKGFQEQLSINSTLILTKSYHLTLKFLGEVQPNKVQEIASILKGIKYENFNIFLDSMGVFPSQNNPRVIWIGLEPENDVRLLQHRIDDSLNDLFSKDKNFKPHITLARIKFIENKRLFFEALEKIKVERKKVKVNEFILIKSTLTPNGSVYEDLQVFRSKL